METEVTLYGTMETEVTLYGTMETEITLYGTMECQHCTIKIGTHAMALWHYRPLHSSL